MKHIFLAGAFLTVSLTDARVGESPQASRHLQVSPGTVVAELGVGESLDVTKTVTTPPIPQNLEICLLSDATGSFYDDQANLQALAPGLVSTIEAASPGAKYGYAAFKDTGDDFVYRLFQSLDADESLFLSAINSLSPFGGGDFPEAQYDGIACATDSSFCPYSDPDCGFSDDPTSEKVLIVTTDASFSTQSDIVNDEASVINALTGKDVRLMGLQACGYCTELDALAGATGGAVLPLTSSGSNIATLIIDGLSGIPALVEPVLTSCSEPGLSLVFDPPSQSVPSGTDAIFVETITVDDPALVGSTVSCVVNFLSNGVSVGAQLVEITIPGEPCTNTIDGFTLVNADTDTEIGPVPPIVDLSTFSPVPEFNFKTEFTSCDDKPIDSVYVCLNTTCRCEKWTPWSVLGDDNGGGPNIPDGEPVEYYGEELSAGTATLFAQGFTGRFCDGEATDPLTQDVEVLPCLMITGFDSYNGVTNTKIGSLDISGPNVVCVEDFNGELNIEAIATWCTDSVLLKLSGPESRTKTEEHVPYMLHGDDTFGDLYGRNMPVGLYSLTATPYPEGELGGTPGPSVTVSFEIVMCGGS